MRNNINIFRPALAKITEQTFPFLQDHRRLSENFSESQADIGKPEQVPWARICRSFKETRYRFSAWRAGTKPYLSYWPAMLQYIGWRNRFLGIDSWLHKRLQIRAQKRVTKGFSKLVRDFIEGSGNFKKTSSTHSKNTCRKNIHLVTLSLSTEGKTRLRRGRLIYRTLLLIVEQKCWKLSGDLYLQLTNIKRCPFMLSFSVKKLKIVCWWSIENCWFMDQRTTLFTKDNGHDAQLCYLQMNIDGHRHQGRCRRHQYSGINHLSLVPEDSGTGRGLIIPVPEWFRHRNFFLIPIPDWLDDNQSNIVIF
jgi:hypothetical protein